MPHKTKMMGRDISEHNVIKLKYQKNKGAHNLLPPHPFIGVNDWY